MLSLTTNTLRSTTCLAAALLLSACAGSGPVKAPAKLATADAGDASASLYSGQLPSMAESDGVVSMLENQVANAPREAENYLKLGVAYRHVERFDEALQVFEQAINLSELPYVARNEIGILHRAQGNFEQAEKTYLGILAEVPDFYDAHFNLGILYDLYLRRPLDAQKHYQAYINNAPDADGRVEKWLVDLQRRHQIDASASAGVVSE